MAKIEVRCLSGQDVVNAKLSMTDVIDLVTSSFTQHGTGRVENPPKKGIHPLGDSFIHSMPAFLEESMQAGLKLVSGFNSNVAKGLPGVAGCIVLNSTETGFPIAFMDASWITGMRTTAASLVSAKLLAPPDPATFGIAGAGLQGRLHGVTMCHLFPSITTIRVYEIWKPNLERFEALMAAQCPHVKVEAMDAPDGAVRDCDIVVCATGKLLEPIFDSAWVKEGALVLPVHTQGWNSDAPSVADKLLCDDWDQFREFAAAYTLPAAPHAETGQVVAGVRPGRESPTERIFCFNTGLAIHDVVVASEVLRRAEIAAAGQMFTLVDTAVDMEIPPFE
mmetsp:Transcript_17683/g.46153  ORF Transcript_17683/g.46153 Transcript_17683/m.46153 type:complete len:335 (-) Transcript_17683:242-1246(-)